jgi:hypothetical protein
MYWHLQPGPAGLVSGLLSDDGRDYGVVKDGFSHPLGGGARRRAASCAGASAGGGRRYEIKLIFGGRDCERNKCN